MSILSLSITFRTASIELRERISLDSAAVIDALKRFPVWRADRMDADAELVILSTCNRLELYMAARDDADLDPYSSLVSYTSEICGLPPAVNEPYLTRYDGLGAALHLCRVAAGLDSMVLGESQILGQVSDAYETAVRAKSIGPTLSTVFRAAIRAGKRAQTETSIGQNPASVGSVAVRMAEQVIGQARLPDAQVLILGAGQMAELVIKALHARGVKRLAVANRTHAHAIVLAQRWGGVALPLEQAEQAMAQADIMIASTGAPLPIIRREQVQRAMQQRPQQPLVLVDIAVPRDIEPAAADVPGVRLLNLDDLQTYVDASLSERQAQAPRVEAIVDEELAGVSAWLRDAEIRPLISDLRKKAEDIRRRELERALRHLPGLDDEARDYIQGMTRALVNKLLHEPTTRLRAAANDDQAAEYAQSIRYLFGLHGSEPGPFTDRDNA
ncbi:MAG: glutamyl-tRNA reductase [Chloroflexi bacterium]|nr:glutamyl-tRNA reductase [Chloroflexota bacterium]